MPRLALPIAGLLFCSIGLAQSAAPIEVGVEPDVRDAEPAGAGDLEAAVAVSYTHLTLPTSDLV